SRPGTRSNCSGAAYRPFRCRTIAPSASISSSRRRNARYSAWLTSRPRPSSRARTGRFDLERRYSRTCSRVTDIWSGARGKGGLQGRIGREPGEIVDAAADVELEPAMSHADPERRSAATLPGRRVPGAEERDGTNVQLRAQEHGGVVELRERLLQ